MDPRDQLLLAFVDDLERFGRNQAALRDALRALRTDTPRAAAIAAPEEPPIAPETAPETAPTPAVSALPDVPAFDYFTELEERLAALRQRDSRP